MTLIDFPGHIAAVLFTQGCPWKCRYCHNPSLWSLNAEKAMKWDEIGSFLKERVGYLEGIVISGGEPLVHKSLPDLLRWIKELGYKTAIHTNGFYPDRVRSISRSGLVDYIAMDVKGTPRGYDTITRCNNSCLPVSKSIDYIISSGVEYEFRTTWHPALLSEKDLVHTMKALSSAGGERYYLQNFRSEGVDDDELVTVNTVLPEDVIDIGKQLFPVFGTR